MPAKVSQYILVPAKGLAASADRPLEASLFRDLVSSFSAKRAYNFTAPGGPTIPVRVIDSIGENKAKLIECSPEHLAQLRASHAGMRVLPVVYYRPATVPRMIASAPVSAAKAKQATSLTLKVVSSADGKPVGGVFVVAFTDFAARRGAQGTTSAKGQVALALGATTKKVERLYLYPSSGFWPGLQQNLTLKDGGSIALQAIDLGFTDCVRFFYGNGDLTLGTGLSVGVIDSGVATNHPDLHVTGGQNTVQGEDPTDFGDNGGEGHGTHVAGIIAARGTPPSGIRGIAPGVNLRSYRVFGKKSDRASNFAIAKAIDAAVTDRCDLINLSLGGGDPDSLTVEALSAAHDAGVLAFVATGNDGRQPVSFPASSNFSEAVTAMGRMGTFPDGTEPAGSVAQPFGKDKKDFIADFSNIGPETDFTGPGVGVISTVPAGFGVMSGTSMATPAQTGAAARALGALPQILNMARDEQRTAAMLTAVAKAATLLGFGPNFEGNGMVR